MVNLLLSNYLVNAKWISNYRAKVKYVPRSESHTSTIREGRKAIIGIAHKKENYMAVKLFLLAFSHLHLCNPSKFFYFCLEIKSAVAKRRHHEITHLQETLAVYRSVQSKAFTVFFFSRLNKLQHVDIMSLVLSVYSAGESSAMNKKACGFKEQFQQTESYVKETDCSRR